MRPLAALAGASKLYFAELDGAVEGAQNEWRRVDAPLAVVSG